VDPQGRLRLFRTLARPGATNARDCAALSVTVAIIVQRYLEEIELPEVEVARRSPMVQVVPPTPPSPSPPPVVVGPPPRLRARWDMSLGISQRFADQATSLEAMTFVSPSLVRWARRGCRLAGSPVERCLGLDPTRLDRRPCDVMRVPSGLDLM